MTPDEAVAIMREAAERVYDAGFDVWGWDDGSIHVYSYDSPQDGGTVERLMHAEHRR